MENIQIAVIGLGYVGLPLARLFATRYPVVGYDINAVRIQELRKGADSRLEVDGSILLSVLKEQPDNRAGLYCSCQADDLRQSRYYIITVPTPVDKNNKPDLTPLITACHTVGAFVKKGDTVIFESTVYPGATEEVCVPVIQNASGLTYNHDFFVGYSPERINPGDREHTIDKVVKVTSGSTPEVAAQVDALYASVIPAGTHRVSSIRIAEAAKVIENTQRDINIAFVNELKKIFDRMDIDTSEVLNAAATKWNFLHFKPGLVGGHCIGVDPYYLAQRAQDYGYHPEIILAGRRINDSMSEYIARQVVKKLILQGGRVKGASILVLGITFKENCADIRNSKVADLVKALQEYGASVDVYDPWADPAEVEREYAISLLHEIPQQRFDAVVHAVNHKVFEDMEDAIFSSAALVYRVK